MVNYRVPLYLTVFILMIFYSACSQQQENKFEIIGMDNDRVFIDYFKKLKQAIKKGDSVFVSQHIDYPIQVDLGGPDHLTIDRKEDLFEHYSQIFDHDFKLAVLSQTLDSVHVNAQAIMLPRDMIIFKYEVDSQTDDEEILIWRISHWY